MATTAATMLASAPSLPVLDMRTYHDDSSNNSESRCTFVDQFAAACDRSRGGVGFFLLRHGMPRGLATEMLQETRRFFALPAAEKEESISYVKSPAFRGYMAMGVENTAGETDWREQVEYAVEYELDAYPSRDDNATARDRQRPYYERLRASENPWPWDLQPSLRPKTLEYVKHVNEIAHILRQTFCRALGLPPDALDQHFDVNDSQHPPHWVLKLLSYPPTPSGFGVGEHVDTNFLTLILQDAPGLQVWVEGNWLDVPHQVSNENENDKEENEYLIVNLGEQAQVLSHGMFVATPHRVLSHHSRASITRPRTSLALFYNPSLQTIITPLPMKENAGSSAANNWKWDRPNRILGTVGENTFKSLARSHPHVLAQHHADLSLQPDGSLLQKSNNE